MYPELFDRLKAEKITRIEHVAALKPDYTRVGGFRFLTASKYPWVDDVFQIVASNSESQLANYRSSVSYPIFVEKAYGFLGSHSWTAIDPIFSIRARYACVFPKQCLFLTHQVMAHGETHLHPRFEPKSACIPEDFLPSLLALRPLLEHGVATLLPQRIVYVDEDEDNYSVASTCYFQEEERSSTIDNCGEGADQFLAQYSQDVGAACLFHEMPWLLNSPLDDFVNLAKSHPAEFELHARSMTELLRAKRLSGENIRALAADLKTAKLALDILYKQKSLELRRKGLDVAVGGLVTAASLLLPAAQALAPLIGGKTAWDGLRLLQDLRDAPTLLSKEKAWVRGLGSVRYRRQGGSTQVSEPVPSCGAQRRLQGRKF